ncbi:DHH family phosphoesterase [Candidatus Woesearchaeota archaeon]|nr:DHH family phosphoesterase [Candidatus Woesearchaeota archaeon]
MDKYEQFKEYVEITLEKFKDIDKKETIRLVSHLDADGIAAISIMIRALNLDNRKYSISIVQQLNKNVIEELSKEAYNYFVFTDLGSGQLSFIKKILNDRKVFILDHHQPEEVKLTSNMVHVNPHLFGIDGSKEVSGAGVVYLFAKNINKKIEDMAHIAIIGAIGDIQEDNGFLRLNDEILETAIKKENIKVIRGLRIFGAQTKPLHKVLEYCTDPYIPGVSGSESGAIQFLHQIGIDPKNGAGWKKIVHLEKEDVKNLVTGIIMRRFNEEKPEDVLGNVYILSNEEKESPTRDAKEFSTLLNACGRMGKASLGIGACLGDKKAKLRAIQNTATYKKEIVNAINWYNENKDSKSIVKSEGVIIINTEDNIMPTIVGTLASIISKSNETKEGTFIMGLAQLLDGTTKVSLRISGYKNKDVDLRDVIKAVTDKVGGEAGGHKQAAGALIATEKEKEFIKAAKEILTQRAIEEKVV